MKYFLIIIWLILFSIYAYNEVFVYKKNVILNNLEFKSMNNLAFESGRDSYEYITGAILTFKNGKPVHKTDSQELMFCKRNITTYLHYVILMFLFNRFFILAYIILLVGIFLYGFYKLLDTIEKELKINEYITFLISIPPLIYSVSYVSRIMSEGLTAIGIIFFLINFIKFLKSNNNKYLIFCSISLIVCSLARPEFVVILAIFSVFTIIKLKNLYSLIISLISLILILENILWNRVCFDASTIWYWNYQKIIQAQIRKKYPDYPYNKIANLRTDSIIREVKTNLGIDVYDYFLNPYHNLIGRYYKERVLHNIKNDKYIQTFILKRILLINPFVFIFTITNVYYMEQVKIWNYVLFSIISVIWGLTFIFCFIILFLKALKEKRNYFLIIFVYLILFIIYDLFYFAGGVEYIRFKSFYSFIELGIISLAMSKK